MDCKDIGIRKSEFVGHPELTRERSISFIWNQTCFVYNSTVFRLTDLFILYLFIHMDMPTKKYLR